MIKLSDLPVGDSPKPIDLPHFPTRQQAFVWRNWQIVPAERLAQVLGTSRKNVLALAAGMGLPVPPTVPDGWLARGYCTIIRNNWHVLSYSQLLQLLGWTAEKLDYTLREDDFLWIKLGKHKPAAEPIKFTPLAKEEIQLTSELRKTVVKYFHSRKVRSIEEPFAFLKDYRVGKVPASANKKFDSQFDLRLIYSYSASYGDPLLHPETDPYPDGMLARYASMGINAVWLQGILYTLYPWSIFPGLSTGWQKRLASLRNLVKRAEKFEIGVYLYFNEPRGLPITIFKDRPDLRGTDIDGISTMCTSLPEIRNFLRDGCEHVFRNVPDLAGVFTITATENPTSCHSRWKSAHECPRCSKRRPAEVVAEVNRLIAEGVHAGNPSARVVAWSWAWSWDWDLEVVNLLPTDVELMCVSEWGLPTKVGGVKGSVVDYSISNVGPSDQTMRLWKRANQRGIRTVAKIQMNNSWELSAVPYLPVPNLVERHIRNLRRVGVTGLMASWTVGGYPGGNLNLIDHKSSELADELFGTRAGPLIRKAWQKFSRAFGEFPFACQVIYNSPNNTGPANLLHEKPTGFASTMVQGFPYDDLKGWRAQYPEDVFEKQWKKLSDAWRRGLVLLKQAEKLVQPSKKKNFTDLENVATAAYCHFRSTYLQVRFVRIRDNGGLAANAAPVRKILIEETELACMLHDIVGRDSRIGFEAANHYSYTQNDLKEKVVQCERLLQKMTR